MAATREWTNSSVLLMAVGEEPVAAITARARQAALRAAELGWSGPPFSILELADLLGLEVTPREEVADARTVPAGRDGVRIEFNPNKPRARVRYSLAHEIGHTLFPDCAKTVRHRGVYHSATGDAWQLEALCNVAAAELLMPAGSFPEVTEELLNIDHVLEIRRRFEVSTEAAVIHAARLSNAPAHAFCASTSAESRGYVLDYCVSSPGSKKSLARGFIVPASSELQHCRAIGFTAKSRERWSGLGEIDLQCVAIPGYPGSTLPRVVGLARPVSSGSPRPLLQYLRGSALTPRSSGKRIVAHVVNDATPNWGGHGFASALKRHWPQVQVDFRRWAGESPSRLRLGNVRLTPLQPDTTVASMIGQRGYGESTRPRVRYLQLRQCLETVAEVAIEQSASVHIPRIGTGAGGGSWNIIRDLIMETICARGVQVAVYDLPSKPWRGEVQRALDLLPQTTDVT